MNAGPCARLLNKLLVDELLAYMREQHAKLSRCHDLAKAIDYIVKRWDAITLFLDDGGVCLSNNAAERAHKGIALGRKLWMFCGSDRGGQRVAAMYNLIVSGKTNVSILGRSWRIFWPRLPPILCAASMNCCLGIGSPQPTPNAYSAASQCLLSKPA